VCYSDARKLVGKSYSVSELLFEIRKDLDFFQNSGGGVTFSGGEPLLQEDFLAEVCKKCRELGIHTAVETAGNVPWEHIQKLIPHLNLIYYDLKHIDSEVHRKYTGVKNERILENFKKLSLCFHPIIVRVPVIPGFNDTVETQQRMYSFLRKKRGVVHVELLPYHRLGMSKYRGLGVSYEMEGIQSLGRDDLVHLERLGKKMGVNVRVGAV
jgi:pyruvate formate lyase activating enzyme